MEKLVIERVADVLEVSKDELSLDTNLAKLKTKDWSMRDIFCNIAYYGDFKDGVTEILENLDDKDYKHVKTVSDVLGVVNSTVEKWGHVGNETFEDDMQQLYSAGRKLVRGKKLTQEEINELFCVYSYETFEEYKNDDRTLTVLKFAGKWWVFDWVEIGFFENKYKQPRLAKFEHRKVLKK